MPAHWYTRLNRTLNYSGYFEGTSPPSIVTGDPSSGEILDDTWGFWYDTTLGNENLYVLRAHDGTLKLVEASAIS